ncbi:MAG: hypothetical protein O2954_00705 [bacterium]|nr:hypothetical protein [bacterium]
MKLSPAATLILTMFGSFVVILVAMIVILRLQSRPAPRKTERLLPRQQVANRFAADSTTQKKNQQPKPREEIKPEVAQIDTPKTRTPQPSPPGTLPSGVSTESQQFQRKLQQEKKEMVLLRKEMEQRLTEELNLRGKKLDQLARQCEKMEPGEAVQILTVLDDATIGEVLHQMNRDAAIKIAALLKRLGREKAISIK